MAILTGLVAELERGVAIIRDIDDHTYHASENGDGSMGAHFRHNLDFVNSFLNGIAERSIDYNARTRNVLIENDREYAVEQMVFALMRLEQLRPEMLERIVRVRSEVDESVWHTSSLSREIEFLHSHTVHHYALIARLLAGSGQAVASDVGVAPSTLKYRARLELAA